MEGTVPWGCFERGRAWRSAESRCGLGRNRGRGYVCGIVRHLHTSEEGQEGNGWVSRVGGCIIRLV